MFLEIYGKSHAAYAEVLRDVVKYAFWTNRYNEMEIYARETEVNISDIVLRTFTYLTAKERTQFWNYYRQWFQQELPLYSYLSLYFFRSCSYFSRDIVIFNVNK